MSPSRCRRQLCSAILAVFVLPILSHAQSPGGEIRLEVKDPSGAAMPASGRLENLRSGAETSFQSGANGTFTLGNLSYGRYRLVISSPGFTTQSLLVEVQSSRPVLRTITMALGMESAKVDVVAATPLAGSGLSALEIPAPVQSATARDLNNSGSLELSDFLNRRLNGVNINENQENPFQPDLNYRGYTASPLLGTPEGISVYMDGVRQNQPFGDVVSWDLIPRIAISDVTLVPGSNPLFGLNSLGGAVSIETKDGRSKPGTSISVYGGSFGRRAVEFEHGGSTSKGLNWYVAGNLLHDDGWRIRSPSDVRQTFGKLGWQGAKTIVSISFAYADNYLTGNGLQEQRFLARNYASGYTYGDTTTNRSPFVNLSVRHAASGALTFSGNAYFRYIRADSVNPNLNTDSLDESVYQPTAADQAALAAAGYTGFPTSGANASNTPFPYWRCIAQGLQFAEPIEKCDAIIIRSFTKQNNYGISGQLTWSATRGGRRNQFTVGAAWDRSSLTFQQAAQFGYINPDYTITPINSYEDGSTNSNGTPVDTRVNLHGLPQTWSIYATDTWSIGNTWSFTVSGRYNRAAIDNRDRIDPGGGPGSLDGQYVFDRLDPSAGVTFSPTHFVNLYASYAESSRAPTSIELGCADPDNPCNLPNALAGDPPLKEVVTHSIEAGVRGRAADWLVWNAGVFRADNHNDILFTANTAGFGYYQNVDKTRRQGVELGATGKLGAWSFGANYTYLDATFRSDEAMLGEGNSSNEDGPGFEGTIDVHPGDRMPLIPKQMFKAFVAWQVLPQLSASVDLLSTSDIIARGNENGEHEPDGTYYLGPGKAGGYAVVNLGVDFRPTDALSLFAQLNNALDKKYYTAAQLGSTGFNAAGDFVGRPFAGPVVDGDRPITGSTFYSPGAPRAVWFGARYSFGADAK